MRSIRLRELLTDGAAIAGLEPFGRPLLYAIFVTALLLQPSAAVDLPGDDPKTDKVIDTAS